MATVAYCKAVLTFFTKLDFDKGIPDSHWKRYGDLAVDNPSDPMAISMLIKKSKTDQGWKCAKIFLGKTGDTLCPITAIEPICQ